MEHTILPWMCVGLAGAQQIISTGIAKKTKLTMQSKEYTVMLWGGGAERHTHGQQKQMQTCSGKLGGSVFFPKFCKMPCANSASVFFGLCYGVQQNVLPVNDYSVFHIVVGQNLGTCNLAMDASWAFLVLAGH